MSLLFETFQDEFCPPLDSSLLAALLADLESDAQGNTIVPSSREIEEFKNILRELSTQADESQLEELSDLHVASNTDDSSSTPEFYQGTTTTSSSDSSEPSQQPFSSPLGFLQAALPHIPMVTLRSALDGTAGDDVDMWDIVADILTTESIREMEERGLGGLDEEDEELGCVLDDGVIGWKTVERKKKPARADKRRSTRGKTISLVDVRQRQHTRKHMNTDVLRPVAEPDPWTQLSSLSSHLATLLPPHSPSFFQSYFHSPEYATPYVALRACLTSICNNQPEISADEYKDTLSNLLEIILPEDEGLDDTAHARFLYDAEISLRVTSGRGNDALDLAKLLRELDFDSTGYLEMGVYHAAPQSHKGQQIRHSNLPIGPSPIPPTPQLPPSPKPPPSAPKAHLFQWNTVPQRRPVKQGPHPLAASIPAYANNAKGVGSIFGKGDVGELNEHKRRMEENIRKRKELLKQATKMWQKGNSKTRGGEIAFYFAERAREFQELARTEALNAARTMVESRRTTSGDPYSVDLHGTTAYEATIIVKDILQTLPTSQSRPLKIITGRGSHSVNQISVLRPAIKKALLEDDWSVGTWDGGLVVRGKQ